LNLFAKLFHRSISAFMKCPLGCEISATGCFRSGGTAAHSIRLQRRNIGCLRRPAPAFVGPIPVSTGIVGDWTSRAWSSINSRGRRLRLLALKYLAACG
jgi:hypothetical protein